MQSRIWSSIIGFLHVIVFLLYVANAEKAPFASFAVQATASPKESHYDYIVIGGGTSGCALAATLSEEANVLVLERGDLPYGYPTVMNMVGFPFTLADITPSSASQLFVSTDGVVNMRASVLGGGSALNAGFYTRASKKYIDKVGWDFKLVNESYKWAEKMVAHKPDLHAWQSAFMDGLLAAGVRPNNGFTYEHLDGTKVGGTIFDENGKRHTAADLFEYADPKRIKIFLHATVYQILFKNLDQPKKKAYGVLFKDKDGNQHTAFLNDGSENEIILSAGALGSPQLLMLSGVGPPEHLMKHGIQVIVNNSMVGQGIADNPMNVVVVPSPQPVEISLVQVVGVTEVGSFIEAASGFVDLSRFGKLDDKLAQLLIKAGSLLDWPGLKDLLAAWNSTSVNVGVIFEKIIGPASTGHLELENTNPEDNPKVTFNYFKEAIDLQRCVDGMKTIIRVLESEHISKFRHPDVSTESLLKTTQTLPLNLRERHLDAPFSLEQYCRDTPITIWHYHGGCQVGRVVDKNYKVFDIDALRVIDGSTYYDSPGTNPQATCMMLGRYMGKKILHTRSENGGRK